MSRIAFRAVTTVLAAGLLAVFATACGSNEDAPAGARTLTFELTDAGCVPHDAEAVAGPIQFEIENGGTARVTEMEIMDGDTVLGERENITEGLSSSFALTLEKGEYTIYCPGGPDERGTLTVTGDLKAENNPEVDAAIGRYSAYLEHNSAELVARTRPFVAAVAAGNVAKAKSLYATARVPYERIEPVAESFGSLDPRIDARANDVPASEFEGFHRIEKALWEEGTARDVAPIADQLLADVEELAAKAQAVDLQAVQIANGANELLGEVSASKITGEEERYSHTDLVDFEANVQGAEAAFQAVEPLLTESAPALAKDIEADFDKVHAGLRPHRRGHGFVSYTQLTEADTRRLAQSIDTLAEKLSEVPAVIAGGERG